MGSTIPLIDLIWWVTDHLSWYWRWTHDNRAFRSKSHRQCGTFSSQSCVCSITTRELVRSNTSLSDPRPKGVPLLGLQCSILARGRPFPRKHIFLPTIHIRRPTHYRHRRHQCVRPIRNLSRFSGFSRSAFYLQYGLVDSAWALWQAEDEASRRKAMSGTSSI
ncbi:hypothetical protein EJ08DRAFT_593204 [Tothia fuscella]|uniref:Uncharacterized protein n=1 Tax=Tothia fuscella TaxID=1048955 RepID=A0A9P4TWL2_9PEZI|nr:hypothetical protein EJ08DRAFT_593204 [Tothia fuscella]